MTRYHAPTYVHTRLPARVYRDATVALHVVDGCLSAARPCGHDHSHDDWRDCDPCDAEHRTDYVVTDGDWSEFAAYGDGEPPRWWEVSPAADAWAQELLAETVAMLASQEVTP